MSTRLHWRLPDGGVAVGGTEIKRHLIDRDMLNQDDRGYLRGLADAGVDGAHDLHEALRKHELIRISVE